MEVKIQVLTVLLAVFVLFPQGSALAAETQINYSCVVRYTAPDGTLLNPQQARLCTTGYAFNLGPAYDSKATSCFLAPGETDCQTETTITLNVLARPEFVEGFLAPRLTKLEAQLGCVMDPLSSGVTLDCAGEVSNVTSCNIATFYTYACSFSPQ